MTKLSSRDQSALYKLTKYQEIRMGEDGRFSVPHKYWSISLEEMRRLEAAGLCRIDVFKDSTFAVATPKAGESS